MQAYTALSGAINLRDSAYRGNGFSLLLFAPLVVVQLISVGALGRLAQELLF